MKKYFIGSLLLLSTSMYAQKTTPKQTVTSKKIMEKPLKNNNDSVSYAIGFMVANFYKQQGIKSLNTSIVSKAINEVFGNKKCLVTESEANMVLMEYINKLQESK